MPYIPAAEFSAVYKNQTVHVLGYFIDAKNLILQEHIQKVQEKDRWITEKLLLSFQKLGAEFELQDLTSKSLHTFYSMQLVKKVALNLFENDPQKTMDAFLKVMKDQGFTYSDFAPWPVREVIDLIHQANGIAVLAHPGGKHDAAMRRLDFYWHDHDTLKEYISWGLDGIETRCPVHSADEVAIYEDFASQYDLLMTSGSDCHGDDDYLGPALMDKFSDIFEDGYERILNKWKEVNR
jgi:hypothetical protein